MKNIIIFSIIVIVFFNACASTISNKSDNDIKNDSQQNFSRTISTNSKEKNIDIDTTKSSKDELTSLLITPNPLETQSNNTIKTNSKDNKLKKKQTNKVSKKNILNNKYKLQIGAFSEISKIEELKYKALPILKKSNKNLKFITITQKTLYKLQIGYFNTREDAEKYKTYLKNNGINSFIIKPQQ